MNITTETHHQPEPQPTPAVAPAYPTTVTQRRPNDYDQGAGQLSGARAGQYTAAGQNTGAGQYSGAGQYTGSGQSIGSGGYNGSGGYSGSGQFAGAGPVNIATEQGYSGSPRFSSTPVDWGSSAATDTSYRGVNQSGMLPWPPPGRVIVCLVCPYAAKTLRLLHPSSTTTSQSKDCAPYTRTVQSLVTLCGLVVSTVVWHASCNLLPHVKCSASEHTAHATVDRSWHVSIGSVRVSKFEGVFWSTGDDCRTCDSAVTLGADFLEQ